MLLAPVSECDREEGTAGMYGDVSGAWQRGQLRSTWRKSPLQKASGAGAYHRRFGR
jgi:hypothetical protein